MEGLWQVAGNSDEPVPSAFRVGHLDVDGIGFDVRHDAELDVRSFDSYCAFGEPPAGAMERAAVRQLLESISCSWGLRPLEALSITHKFSGDA
jgi:hypothetical protein